MTAALLLTISVSYAQLQAHEPNGIKRAGQTGRGRILAADGSVLAMQRGEERRYPMGSLAGQLIGAMGTDQGLEGIEASCQQQLAAGEDVQLNIQPEIQAATERAMADAAQKHGADYAMALVVESDSGKIVADATWPPLNPGDWRAAGPERLRHRTFIDRFEPGSTMKPISVAIAIEGEYIDEQTSYDTPMRRHVGGRWGSVINDAVAHGPRLDTVGVLRYSSNVGMSHIVEKVPAAELRSGLASFGFGVDPPPNGLPSASGVLQPLRAWDDLVKTTSSFGQGMSSTLLQLTAAYNILAQDGLYRPLQVIEAGSCGVKAQETREVMDPGVSRRMRRTLETVIDQGIFHAAGLPGYHVGGKTGTAQVVVDGRYSNTVYDSLFTGFFPATQPRYTIAVMAHNAKREHHGAQLAAPAFRQIAAAVASSEGLAIDTKDPQLQMSEAPVSAGEISTASASHPAGDANVTLIQQAPQ